MVGEALGAVRAVCGAHEGIRARGSCRKSRRRTANQESLCRVSILSTDPLSIKCKN